MDNYIKGPTLGEGTFGSVFKATHKETGRVVAIKKIRVGNKSEGINVTALREIKLLRELQSPYIIELIDVFPRKDKLSLVFEFMESDLEAVIKDRSLVLGAADVKSYMQMILRAIAFCHKNWVLHRDVKPNNMLIGPTGELKLADFGLARVYGSPGRQYTNQVFARWYRAPELLFGSTMYTSAVDMWAMGCVFAELLLRRPWFPGVTDIDQLGRIFQALGTPNPEQWTGLRDLPTYIEFNPTPKPPLRSLFAGCPAGDDALELLSAMVQFDPNRRITAEQALEHPYFTNYPPPTPPHDLPRPTPRESAPLQQAPLPTISIARPHNMPSGNEGAENLSPLPQPAKKRSSLPNGGHGPALGYISPNTPSLANMATDE